MDDKSRGGNPLSKTARDLGDQTFLLGYAASFTALCAEGNVAAIKLEASRVGRGCGVT